MKPKVGMQFHSPNKLFIGLITQVNKNNFQYVYALNTLRHKIINKQSPFSRTLKIFEKLLSDGTWKLIENGVDKLDEIL